VDWYTEADLSNVLWAEETDLSNLCSLWMWLIVNQGD
jgi:hypothetical protein